MNVSTFFPKQLLKAVVAYGALILMNVQGNAQNSNANTSATGANWKSNGNAATTADFIGTTNAQDLIFKTNNTERLILSKGGSLIVKDRINPGNGGEIIISPGLIHRPIPSNPIAEYLFKVGGGGFFEGEVNTLQLYVERMIEAKGIIKGPRIDVDTIKMDSTRGIYGHTKIFGDVNIKQNLTVDGNATFKSIVTAEKGLLFDAVNGIKFVPNTMGGGTFRYGGNNIYPPLSVPCAAGPQSWANHLFGGMIQLYETDATGAYFTGSGLLNLQTWHFTTPINSPSGPIYGGSSIDASIGGKNDPAALLLNYFCGNDVIMCTGQYGGTVTMGKKVSMEKNVGIGNAWPNSNIDANVALNIFANEDKMTALKLNVWNGTVKAIDLVNPGNGISNFTVWQNGKTQIGTLTQKTGPHTDAMLTVNGKAVAQSFYVTTSNWADYVFADDYKIQSLEEIEKYYKENKHLKDIPNEKEVIENGINVAEMNTLLLKKIEELTILMVEQNKKLNTQQQEINELKNKLTK